ncbi:MepB domain protein [Leptospira noguchii str. Bonito]|nr:MepB domain protein [Leptospira noguchii str. Bonito]
MHNQNRTGQFIFTKDVLLRQGILNGNKEGKLGFRVYPLLTISSPKRLRRGSWNIF